MELDMIHSKKYEMKLEIDASSENESLVRICVAAFLVRLNPTMEELEDVKTAVCEAVTNAIIHGNPKDGKVHIFCEIERQTFRVKVIDYGVGIEDVEKAMEPLYTTKPELERSGMGFAFMEAFMHELSVESKVGAGTKVYMERRISKEDEEA